MSEWWTYSLDDFLLFSPRVYWRMFELHNEAVWPLHVVGLLLGLAILAWAVRPRARLGRVVSAGLAVAWIWLGWSFLWNRYSAINWAIAYLVPVFVVEGLLLAWFGLVRRRLQLPAHWSAARILGLSLLLYALFLHPLVALLAGRPIYAAEVFGTSPDPTAIATLGVLAMARRGAAVWLLLLAPLAWCLVSATTLLTMGAPEGYPPLVAAALAVAARVIGSLRPAEATR